MSLKSTPFDPVPDTTARIARAAFPKGNPYLSIRDELGALWQDHDFAHLFAHEGQPAECPWRLALVSVLQFVEQLTDRQAADAVRARLDWGPLGQRPWKYLLGLALDDAGFDSSVLSEFRSRLVSGQAEALLLDRVLTLCKDRGWLKARIRQRTDSTHVLAAIRGVTRLECVGETLRAALNTLAVVAPDWLRLQVSAEWAERYAHRIEDPQPPKSESKRQQTAQDYGEDGHQLLDAVFASTSPWWLRQVPAVETLRRVWVQQYYRCEGMLRWRTSEEIPPASVMVSSPYEPDAHYAKKYTTTWIGYKVHLSETCEPGLPHLITNVETTAAPVADGVATPRIHDALAAKDLLPDKHIVDTGYLDAELLATCRAEHGVDLVGPTRLDYHWQAQHHQGFAASDFQVDWHNQQATCPEGKLSTSWSPALDKHSNAVVKIKFADTDCSVCPSHSLCTRSKRIRRTPTLRCEPHYHALQVARQREQTDNYKEEYARRAGIEGTLSEGVRAHGLRHCRYIGMAKTHLQHLLTAVAINLKRIIRWLEGTPLAASRTSRFAQLMQPLSA